MSPICQKQQFQITLDTYVSIPMSCLEIKKKKQSNMGHPVEFARKRRKVRAKSTSLNISKIYYCFKIMPQNEPITCQVLLFGIL